MLFNSFTFIVFFAVVFLSYYVLPHKLRWILLLVASLTFYMWWKAELIVLILISTISNFCLALAIDGADNEKTKKLCVVASAIINFSLLFIFKYLIFTNNVIAYLFGAPVVENLNILLPMGISFYTFQAAAYTFDVYRKTLTPQRNYLKFLLFITFFPQLVAGPIERAKNLMPQLFEPKRLELSNVTLGPKIALWGYFKKVVIADRAAILVNGVFNSIEYYGFLGYATAVLLFAFQIYCDFSGYSDIAIGCSKMLGINLMQNFDRPYFAHSLRDHWRRWHISLSTWFKDYVYFPLGGNRTTVPRHYLNIIITFAVSGLWHGANMTYVVWGLFHGVFQVLGIIKDKILKPKPFNERNPLSKLFSIAFTFALACFLFAIFRANSIEDAIYLYRHFFRDFRHTLTPEGFYIALNALPITIFELLAVLSAILFLFLVELVEIAAGRTDIHVLLDKTPVIIKFVFYFTVIVAIFSIGVFSGAEEFIYFQF